MASDLGQQSRVRIDFHNRDACKEYIRAMFLDLPGGHGKPRPTLTFRWEFGSLPTTLGFAADHTVNLCEDVAFTR